MSIVPSPPANATPTARGLMSAADKSKLDGIPPGGGSSVVTSVTQANGLTLTTGDLAMGAAGVAAPGAVTTGAQEFAGAKTLTGTILNGVSTIAEAVTSLVRAVGASLVLRSSLGAGASDVAVKVGTSETDAGTSASAKLLSVRTGLGGTEVERAYVLKDGSLVTATGRLRSSVYASSWVRADDGAARLVFATRELQLNNTSLAINNGTTYIWSVDVVSGRLDQSGTDSSGTPGAATINKPTGKSAIASGATSVRITNSLVAVGDQVHVTWHGDPGATFSWVTTGAGFFDVNLNGAASANTAFCWTVSKRL